MTTIDALTQQLHALDREEAELAADAGYVEAKRRRDELIALGDVRPLSSHDVAELAQVRQLVTGYEAEIARNRGSLGRRREALRQEIAALNAAEWPRESSKDRKELQKAVAKAIEIAQAIEGKRAERSNKSGVVVFDVPLTEALGKLTHVATALMVEPSGSPDADRTRIGTLRIAAVNGG